MDTKISLKKAKKNSDIDKLIEVDKSIEDFPYYKPYLKNSDWYSAFEKCKDIYFVTSQDLIVGNIYFYPINTKRVHLDGFLVMPTYWYKGYGSQALDEIIFIAKYNGYKEMELVTHPENSHAIQIYRKCGFEEKGIIQNYHGDGEPRLYFIKIL